MQAKSKKILVTSDHHEIISIRRTRGAESVGYCPTCGQTNTMLDLDLTVALTGRPTREILRLIESGEIHSIEALDGHLLFCLDSLSGLAGERINQSVTIEERT